MSPSIGDAGAHKSNKRALGNAMKIAALSIADYCEATSGLDDRVERLFFRILLWMFSNEAMLPDDDHANARRFGYDIRRYRTLKAKLLVWPKRLVALRDGMLVSPRAEREISKVQARMDAAREAGRLGGLAAAGRRFTARDVDTSAQLRLEIDPDVVSKSTTIPARNVNDYGVLDVASPSPSPTPCTQPDVPKQNQSTEKESCRSAAPLPVSTQTTGRPAPTPSARLIEDLGEKQATVLLTAVALALPAGADPEFAIDWLEGEVQDSGAPAVRTGHKMLVEKRRQGERIRQPLAWWSKTAATIATKARAVMAAKPSAADDDWKAGLERLKERTRQAQLAVAGGAHA